VKRNFSNWQTYTDAGSHSSLSTVTTRFEYNADSTNKIVSLGANYIDAAGKKYNGTITLAPYSSAILILNTNAPKLFRYNGKLLKYNGKLLTH
jgi:hypothetical protein